MKFFSARQAIHDAYAIHLTSKGFEVNLVSATRKPDFSDGLTSIHRCKDATRAQKLAEFNPVGFYAEDRSQKQNNDSRICDAVEAGMVIAAVESLEEPFQSWAKWAYGPRTEHFLPEQGRFFQWLEQDVSEKLASSERDYRETTRQRIKDVVAYTVLDYRSYVTTGRHIYPSSLIIKKCRIQRQNWKRDFQQWQEDYWGVCDGCLDRRALFPVGRIIYR